VIESRASAQIALACELVAGRKRSGIFRRLAPAGLAADLDFWRFRSLGVDGQINRIPTARGRGV